MDTRFPYIKNADEKLRDICEKNLENKYPDESKPAARERLESELSIVKFQRLACDYLIVYRALTALEADEKDYIFGGTIGSSIIAYLLNFSHIEPLGVGPKLYPEFYFGLFAEKEPLFEVRIANNELFKRLSDYFINFQDKNLFSWRSFDDGSTYKFYIQDKEIKNVIEDFGTDITFSVTIIHMADKSAADRTIRQGAAFDICKPVSFADQVKCYGLEHSTGAWEDNAELLLKNGVAGFDDLIAFREDVYEFLQRHGIEKDEAYLVAEELHNGKINRNGWDPMTYKDLENAKVPKWYIESCEKIVTLFSRAHGMAFLDWCRDRHNA